MLNTHSKARHALCGRALPLFTLAASGAAPNTGHAKAAVIYYGQHTLYVISMRLFTLPTAPCYSGRLRAICEYKDSITN